MLAPAVLLAVLLAQQPATLPPPVVYVPERVYDTAAGAFIDFEVMLARLVPADVVFVGETHGDPNTHRLEAAVLDGLRRRKVAPIVSLEMFERDVQPVLDDYLAGRVTEGEMMERARPWPRFATDYRPLLELARREHWTVVAANVPRRLAADVSKAGPAAIERFEPADRALVARDLQCPLDRYFERFEKSMAGHTGVAQTAAEQRQTLERYYWAQCIKDETMAESIAAAAARPGRSGPVVHYNGAFHSDFGLGAAERTRRRLPRARIVVISVLPVADLDALSPAGEDLERADYLLYTAK